MTCSQRELPPHRRAMTNPHTTQSCDVAVLERLERTTGLLTHDEQLALARLVAAGLGEHLGATDWTFAHLEPGTPGRRAAELMVVRNLGLVHDFLRKNGARGRFEDALQDGTIGLMRAVLKFDPDAGYTFATYAMNWIRQSVNRGRQNGGDLVRLPVHVHELSYALWTHMRDTDTTLEEVVAANPDGLPELGISTSTLAAIWAWNQDMEQLEHVTDEEVRSLTPGTPTAAARVDLDEEALLTVMGQVDSRAPDMVARYFGLHGGEPETLHEIGADYGLTRERVRQIKEKALKAARTHLVELAREDRDDRFAMAA